jgi:hypothetical protein
MTSSTRHSHGVHCLHWHGWDMARWCATCRQSFEQFEGVEGEWVISQSPTPEDRAAWRRLFERYVDTTLAYAVLVALERGELPMPPSFDPIERFTPLPAVEVEPSTN